MPVIPLYPYLEPTIWDPGLDPEVSQFSLLTFWMVSLLFPDLPPYLVDLLKNVTITNINKLINIELNDPYIITGFPGSSNSKESPAMQETWVLSLGWEDPLEKDMATHSSILAWRISWTEKPGRL